MLREPGDDPVSVGDPLRVYPLQVGARTIAGLVVGDPLPDVIVPLLRQSLALLLDQGVRARELGQETLDRYREINTLHRLGERIGSLLDTAGIPAAGAGDEKLLLAIAAEGGVAYDRARLHEERMEHERSHQELSIGRRIQLSLLPASAPSIRVGSSRRSTRTHVRWVGTSTTSSSGRRHRAG